MQPGHKPLILIVDDEMDMRLFISTLFETGGCRAVAVRDGRQGMAKAVELRPDLIILDMMMPQEGGARMFQELKADPDLRRIPVIVLSAVAENTFRHYLHMLNSRIHPPIAPPEAYVEKPPDPQLLLSMAKTILGYEDQVQD